jgi:hypothetical protein
LPGVRAQLAKIKTNKGKLGLLRIYAFNAADALHRFLLRNIASQSVDGIGRINDYAAAAQAIGYLLQQSRLGVVGMHAYQHKFYI